MTEHRGMLGLTLMAAGCSVALAGAAELNVELKPRAGLRLAGLAGIAVEAQPEGGFSQTIPGSTRSAPLGRGNSATLVLDKGSWRVLVRGDRVWSAPQAVELSSESQAIVLPVWPKASLTAEVLDASGRALSEPVFLNFEASPVGPDPPPSGRSDCTPGPPGQINCELPAGKLDLRLSMRDRVPVYRWDQALLPAAPLRLGRVVMPPGASISGFVATGQPESCRVELTTAAGQPVALPEEAWTPTRRFFRSTPGTRGFFQLPEVPAGQFRVAVSCGQRKSVAGTAVFVRENSETRLPRSLQLSQPVELSVALSPPTDPAGAAWRLELIDASRVIVEDSLEATVSATGRARFPEVSSGSYDLDVLTQEGARWLTRPLAIAEGVRQTLVRLDVGKPVRLEGTLSLGDKPLKAALTLRGNHGVNEVSLSSDEGGRFEGFIPDGPFKWSLEVRSDAPTVARKLEHVELEVGEDGTRRLDVRLASAVVRGQVVDEEGQPGVGTIVTLQPTTPGSVEAPVVVRSDDTGHFETFGLPTGPLLVSAETRGFRSDPVEVVVGPEETFVRLVATDAIDVEGIVVSDATGEPVAGARIEAVAETVPPARQTATQSDAAGRFTLHNLPRSADSLRLRVVAPGYLLDLRRIPSRATGPIELRLTDRGGGELALELPGEWDLHDLNGPNVALFHDGIAVSLNALIFNWHRVYGVAEPVAGQTFFSFASMPPGTYDACVVPTYVADRAIQKPPLACTRGILTDGASLTLRVQKPRPES